MCLLALGVIPVDGGGLPAARLRVRGASARPGGEGGGARRGRRGRRARRGVPRVVGVPARRDRAQAARGAHGRRGRRRSRWRFVTATFALEELARLRMGESVLIHAATGGVGLAAIQIRQALRRHDLCHGGQRRQESSPARARDSRMCSTRARRCFAEEIPACDRRGAGSTSCSNSPLPASCSRRASRCSLPTGASSSSARATRVEGSVPSPLSLFARGASFCAVGYQGAIPRLALALRRRGDPAPRSGSSCRSRARCTRPPSSPTRSRTSLARGTSARSWCRSTRRAPRPRPRGGPPWAPPDPMGVVPHVRRGQPPLRARARGGAEPRHRLQDPVAGRASPRAGRPGRIEPPVSPELPARKAGQGARRHPRAAAGRPARRASRRDRGHHRRGARRSVCASRRSASTTISSRSEATRSSRCR